MRITALELHNIKSYAEPTRIEFSNGVNAVCGPNGSGKTTILEAIGFVLFDYLPYSQAAFLREGQKWGTIRLWLVGRDGREYEVVRRVGSGAVHYVADPETGTRIADRKETITWIREKVLDLDGEAELATLFKNAIGVPQGLMTADFQGAPASRKTIFDPILRVEEYRQAFEYLLQSVNYVHARGSQIEGEIGVLRADVALIPEREAELATLREGLAAGEKRLARAEAGKAEAEAKLASLEAAAKRLQRLDQEVQAAEYNVRRFVDRVSAATDELREAEQAREIVTASEPGYRIVVEARARLHDLEKRRAERDRLAATLEGAQAERKGIFDQIQELDRQRQEAEEAASAAAGLVEVVRRQSDLEQQHNDLAVTLSGLAQLDDRIGRLEQQSVSLRADCERREGELARAREAEEQSAGLPAAQAELDRIIGRLGQLETLRQRQQQVRDEGKSLRLDSDRLAAEVERLASLRSRMTILEPVAAGLDALQNRQQSTGQEQARLAAALAYQALARDELERTHCPLLDLRCPAVEADRTLLARLDQRDTELAAQEETLRVERAAVDEQVRAAVVAREELQRLQVEAASLARSEDELTRIDERLTRCRQEYRELSDKLGEIASLETQRTSAQATIQALQAAGKLAGGRALLEAQQTRDTETLGTLGDELTRLIEERSSLAAAEAQAVEVARALAALEDPRTRQQHLLALAGRKAAIEESLHEQEDRLSHAAGRVKALVARLQTFENLDDELAGEQDREATHAGDFEQYLQHRDLAAKVEPRAAALADARAELDRATERHAGVSREREEAAAGYDASAHEEAKEAAGEAGNLVVRERTLVEQAREHITRAERELAELRRKAEQLRRREGERDELVTIGRALSFIRDTIKAAGPAVTDSLLRTISAGANEIFAEIMDDHTAELRWDRDYEILVQRGPETRKFAQLSGGEQMSAALAVRLALLKEMSGVDFAFFDEPTQNMDGARRSNLAGQISQVKGFEQLIVISHDDTFEHHTDNLIRLEKRYEETAVAT